MSNGYGEQGEGGRPLVIAGGGTGGHLFPGLALADEYRRRYSGARILYVGVTGKMEEQAVPAAGYEFYGLAVAGIKGVGLTKKVRASWLAARAVGESRRLLRTFRPGLAIGVGGYSSGPVGLAARSLGVPLVLQEQNTVPGLTNRLLGRIADRIFIAFEDAAAFFPTGKTRATGNPIRETALGAGREAGSTEELRVLVLGGSRGARGVNETVTAALALPALKDGKLAVVHQTGREDRQSVADAYAAMGLAADVREFIDDMGEQYDWADVVVSRSGAGAVSEISANGRPALFIPYPHAAGGHQQRNARWLVERGGALMIDEGEEGAAARIAGALATFLGDRSRLREMALRSGQAGRKDAARRIVDECVGLLTEKEG